MSALLTIDNAELAYGLHPLLDGAGLLVARGERIGLIGRNGTGKSSLLRIVAGEGGLDGGVLHVEDGAKVILVEQEPTLPAAVNLHQSLLLRGGFAAMHDERERWRLEARLAEFAERLGVHLARDVERLSGGERKRAALALALALQPDLLLLDEPTNHLDIEGITQLESLLARVPSAIVITHDRAFLDRVATRIVELDRGLLRSYPGNYSAYAKRKSEQLEAEATAARKFDKFWADEEVWIRQGIKARRTRNEGRVRRLERLRNERAERRERMRNVRLSIDAGERSGKRVAELEHVSMSFGDKRVVNDLSLAILRGDRIGLIGPNGAGKTTLIRLILGRLEPDSGTVKLGTNIQLAYFDQMREQLDPQQTVAETISPGSDWVEINGERKHIMSYLADFLFPPQRARTPVRSLSGGERNRLLLARLFARPANVLVLDEPTNDLDIESLELLEDTLQSYSGTLLLVSHDRVFLDNVVTQTLVAEGDGRWQEYAGGYEDWLLQRPVAAKEAVVAKGEPRPVREKAARRRLGFNEQRELQNLPREIEVLEHEQEQLIAKLAGNAPATEMQALATRAAAIGAELEQKFARWAQLEERSGE